MEKLEIKGVTIHFSTDKTQKGYVESCRVMYNEGVEQDNMATIYKSIKDFYAGIFFENKE